MSPNRPNSDQYVESRRPRTISESRCAEEGEFDISEFPTSILVVRWLPGKPSRKLKRNSEEL